MATTSRSGVIDRLRSATLDLVSLVTGADGPRLRRVPEEGGWSAGTVVAHLADAELVYSVRLRTVLTAERPWLAAFAEEAWADRLAPLEADARESLRRWRVLREANLRLLASLSEDEWRREGVHEERGALSVAAIADLLADHDRQHLDRIRRCLAD